MHSDALHPPPPHRWDEISPPGMGAIRRFVRRVLAFSRPAPDAEPGDSMSELARIARMWLWEVDLEARYVFASDGAVAITGYRPEDLIGRPITVLAFPEDRGDLEENAREKLREGRSFYDAVNRLRHRTGREVWVSSSGVPILDESGAVTGFRGVDVDVTDVHRRTSRVQQQAHRESLGMVAAGIAHDFNNTLQGILGNAELLRPSVARNRDAERRIDQTVQLVKHARRLCSAMLSYSGKQFYRMESLDLSAVVRELLGETSDVRTKLERDPPAIRADHRTLCEVVTGLLTNAREATEDGGGAIRITTVTREIDRAELDRCRHGEDRPEGRYLVLRVEDEGGGMDAETLRQAFEPFFSTKFAGRGLGLAAIDGIVREHDGAIHIASIPGTGTRVDVLFPVTRD